MSATLPMEINQEDSGNEWPNASIPKSDLLVVRGKQFLEKGTFHGLSDAMRQTNRQCRVFWISVICFALASQVTHMAFLFDAAIQSATVTNIRYARVQELSLPYLTLCGHPGKFFDSDKLNASNLSLSVALTFASMYGMFDPSVPRVTAETDEFLFAEALELNQRLFGNFKRIANSKKLSLFLLNYTIDCRNLMFGCQQGFAGAGRSEKCCRSFKPVMTGKGLCYAFDHSGWNRSKVAGVFTGFSFYLNHSRLRFDDPVYKDHWKFLDLSDVSVAVSNGIEQSPLTNNYVAVGPGDDIHITTTTTLLSMMSKTNKCVHKPQLDFYRDYTINNCVWERGFYKHKDSPYCSIAFDLTRLGFDFPNYNGNGSVITSEGDNFTDCSPEKIRRTYLNNTLNYVEWVTRIDVPSTDDVCLFPCDYVEQSASILRNSRSFEVSTPNSLVKIIRTSMNPNVVEVEKFGWQDYLCLVGGAMGFWTGSSMMTILQMTAGNATLLMAAVYRYKAKKNEQQLRQNQPSTSNNC